MISRSTERIYARYAKLSAKVKQQYYYADIAAELFAMARDKTYLQTSRAAFLKYARKYAKKSKD